MTLPIAKYPSYLSPSSLKVFERQPNTFYLQRMAPDPIPYEPQSLPAAVGSAFDYYVKIDLVKKGVIEESIFRDRIFRDIWNPTQKDKLQDKSTAHAMWVTNVSEEHSDEAEKFGKFLFDKYRYNGYKPEIFEDIEIHRHYNLLPDPVVPLFGKLDATVRGPDGDVEPFDWKTSGYGSESGMSPKKGYSQAYRDGQPIGAHKDYSPDVPMHEINPEWAAQLCVYGWIMGKPIGVPFYGQIEGLFIRSHAITVAKYRAEITQEFQIQLAARFRMAWLSIKTGSFLRQLNPIRDFVELAAAQEEWWM